MAYGHAERNLALIRQLEAETRQLLESRDQPDPEQSAAGGVRENDWEGDVQRPLVTLALEVRTVNDAGSPERAALLAANVARER